MLCLIKSFGQRKHSEEHSTLSKLDTGILLKPVYLPVLLIVIIFDSNDSKNKRDGPKQGLSCLTKEEEMPLFDKVVHSFHWREFYLLMQAAPIKRN